MLLLEGHIRNLLVEGDRIEPAGRQEAPTWMGAISVLTGGPLGVRMQAETDCRVNQTNRYDGKASGIANTHHLHSRGNKLVHSDLGPPKCRGHQS